MKQLTIFVLLVLCAGCGSCLYRIGTTFTDHTATSETEATTRPDGVPYPTIVSTSPADRQFGNWCASAEHPVWGTIVGYGDTWEEAAQDFEHSWGYAQNVPVERKTNPLAGTEIKE